jgi:chromosomal replication initiator protein
MADAAVTHVVTSETKQREPFVGVLMLFGPSGTGKTHLSRGLVQYWQACRGAESADYMTAQDFRHQLIEAMDQNAVVEFRRRLRSRELLVIDDLHRLKDDEFLLHELRFTLDAHQESGGTVLVTSHRPATSLGNLTPDLHSRLASGLLLELAAPGSAARARIVRHVSNALHRPLSSEAVAKLAAGLRGTTVQLLAALYEFFAELPVGAAGDSEQANRLLTRRATRQPELPKIVAIVAKYYGLPQKQLKSGSRRQSVVQARAMITHLARDVIGTSYQQIGKALGGRDHTTIIHNYKKIERQRKRDLATQKTLDDLRRILLSR